MQDKRNGENRKKVQENSVFRDDVDFEDSDDTGDEESPYARIDTLQRQIMRRRQLAGEKGVGSPPRRVTLSQDSAVPAPGGGGGGGGGVGGVGGGGRPLSISAQVFSMPSQHKSTPSLMTADMYETVEEVLPSPFLNYDIVSARNRERMRGCKINSVNL